AITIKGQEGAELVLVVAWWTVSIAGADHSRATDHRRAMDHSIARAEHSRAMDHSIAGAEHSIAGTERGTPGMVRREGSPLSRRHVLVSPASPPQRSSLRQSEAFSCHLSFLARPLVSFLARPLG